MSEHIKPEHSMALMALAGDDPERVQAEQHAAACAECHALLREGQTMLGWVDDYAASPEVAHVDAALKARVRNVVLTPVATPKKARAKWALSFGMLVSVLLALFEAEPGELSLSLGIHCMAFEGLVAVAPFTIAAYLGLRGVIRLEPLNLATVTMAGALAGQMLLHFRCASHATPHQFAFHVLGVALAALLGYAVTAGLVRVRAGG